MCRGPNPKSISTLGLASSAFARHYSRNLVWFLFLQVLRCFSSLSSPRIPMYSVYVSYFFSMSVSTFGHLRVEAYLQLTVAFRSLSRPSSAPDAKAFALCSYSLELPLRQIPLALAVLSLNCLSFINKFIRDPYCRKKVFSFLLHLNHFHLFGEIVFTLLWKDQLKILLIS